MSPPAVPAAMARQPGGHSCTATESRIIAVPAAFQSSTETVELLYRIALVVTPQRRFLEWVNRLPDAGKPLTIEDAASLRMVYLAALGDEVPPLAEVIEIYWEEMFEESLDGWTNDEALWPTNRTAHVFRDWLHVD